MKYTKNFEVRWSEIDVNWHMRNTAYAELGTTIRFSYLRENGFPHIEFIAQGFGPVILREETRYFREVLLDQTITVDFTLAGISSDGSHFELHHDVILPDGTKAATMRVEGAWLDLETRKIRSAPDPLLESLLRLDRTDDFKEMRSLVRKKD